MSSHTPIYKCTWHTKLSNMYFEIVTTKFLLTHLTPDLLLKCKFAWESVRQLYRLHTPVKPTNCSSSENKRLTEARAKTTLLIWLSSSYKAAKLPQNAIKLKLTVGYFTSHLWQNQISLCFIHSFPLINSVLINHELENACLKHGFEKLQHQPCVNVIYEGTDNWLWQSPPQEVIGVLLHFRL